MAKKVNSLRCKISRALLRLRINSGLTQAEVAKKSRILQVQISRFENGTRSPTGNLENLVKLGKVFNLKPHEIIKLAEEEPNL